MTDLMVIPEGWELIFAARAKKIRRVKTQSISGVYEISGRTLFRLLNLVTMDSLQSHEIDESDNALLHLVDDPVDL